MKPKGTSDALEILRRHRPDTPELQRLRAEARLNRILAELIHEARQASGLSQRELAARIGSSQAHVSRLESDSYYGHSVSQLAQLFAALGLELEVRVQPLGGKPTRPTKVKALPERAKSPAPRARVTSTRKKDLPVPNAIREAEPRPPRTTRAKAGRR